MTGLKSAMLFVLQSFVVGLAVAFLIVLVRPDLLPNIAGRGVVASHGPHHDRVVAETILAYGSAVRS